MDIYKESQDKAEELTDKYWEGNRQIALYDDQLKKAMKLLDKVSEIHYAAIRGSSQEAAMLSGSLMHQVRGLELEIRASEVRNCGQH